jgi:uncharacterized protein (TIGR04255 family)
MGDSVSLPSPKNEKLAASPLTVVVAQLRYEPRPEVSDREFLRSFAKALGGKYPRVEEATSVRMTLAPDGTLSNKEEGRGWKLQSADGEWSVVVLQEAVALETTKYQRWAGFMERLALVLGAVENVLSPATEQRLGLRYVDTLRPAGAMVPVDWAPRIRPEFLGPVLHASLGEMIRLGEQRLALDLGDGLECSIRHGFAPTESGEMGYVLDFDAFRDSKTLYDGDDIRRALEALHDKSKSLFQECLSEAYYEELREGRDKP